MKKMSPEQLSDDDALKELAASEGMTIDELRADNLRLRKEVARAGEEYHKLRRIILAALDVEDPDA